jgi:hypothetical protein
VLLKQPGDVPGEAGVVGCREEFAPLVWQSAQTAALLSSVVVCVLVPLAQFWGWGAFMPWQEEQAVLEIPPEKSVPWHSWQLAKPPSELDCFAAAPWESALDQSAAMCLPVSGSTKFLLFPSLHPAIVRMSPKSRTIVPFS